MLSGQFPADYGNNWTRILNLYATVPLERVLEEIVLFSSNADLRDLSGNPFTGSLPPSIFNLSSLRYLSAYASDAHVQFPSLLRAVIVFHVLSGDSLKIHLIPKNFPRYRTSIDWKCCTSSWWIHGNLSTYLSSEPSIEKLISIISMGPFQPR